MKFRRRTVYALRAEPRRNLFESIISCASRLRSKSIKAYICTSSVVEKSSARRYNCSCFSAPLEEHDFKAYTCLDISIPVVLR